MISTGEKEIDLLPTFKIDENAKFQLEVNEKNNIAFFPSKFTDPWITSIDPWRRKRNRKRNLFCYK